MRDSNNNSKKGYGAQREEQNPLAGKLTTERMTLAHAMKVAGGSGILEAVGTPPRGMRRGSRNNCGLTQKADRG